jgi:AraC-like DNA-binding protein
MLASPANSLATFVASVSNRTGPYEIERERASVGIRTIQTLILIQVRHVEITVPTQRPSTVRLRTSLFHEAAEIVDREFAADLSLDDIARRVASSRRQLQRAYAEIGQTTFRDHLTRVRMQKAADMLATRALTVREVAHRVGYRQPAQFAKAFRRYQGVAPSDFRANGSPRSGSHSEQPGARSDGLRPAFRAA